jgi:hypothetical protein
MIRAICCESDTPSFETNELSHEDEVTIGFVGKWLKENYYPLAPLKDLKKMENFYTAIAVFWITVIVVGILIGVAFHLGWIPFANNN